MGEDGYSGQWCGDVDPTPIPDEDDVLVEGCYTCAAEGKGGCYVHGWNTPCMNSEKDFCLNQVWTPGSLVRSSNFVQAEVLFAVHAGGVPTMDITSALAFSRTRITTFYQNIVFVRNRSWGTIPTPLSTVPVFVVINARSLVGGPARVRPARSNTHLVLSHAWCTHDSQRVTRCVVPIANTATINGTWVVNASFTTFKDLELDVSPNSVHAKGVSDSLLLHVHQVTSVLVAVGRTAPTAVVVTASVSDESLHGNAVFGESNPFSRVHCL